MNNERHDLLFNFVIKAYYLKSLNKCLICCEEFNIFELKQGCYRCSALLHLGCLNKYNKTINHNNCENKNKQNLHNKCKGEYDIIDHCPQCRLIKDFKTI